MIMAQSPQNQNKFETYLSQRISKSETYSDLLKFPRYIEIETVNVCNARCPMCTIEDWERPAKPGSSRMMGDELFKKIADQIIENKDQVKRVSLYRDGEPLIDKKLAERVAYLKKGGVDQTCISTNVSLLTPDKARDLLHAGLDTIILSIDSLKKEVYESIRVRLKFEEVLANALSLIELRNEIRPETKIWVRMIRQESNKDEWPSYFDFWKTKLNLSSKDRCYFHNLFNWGNQLEGFRPIAKSFEPGLPCVALWSLMVIFTDGRVPLCNVDYNQKFPIGDATKDSLKSIWQSKLLNEKRELHLKGEKAKISICDNCNVWDESPDLEGISSQYAEAVDLKS